MAGHSSLEMTSRYIETDSEAQRKLVNFELRSMRLPKFRASRGCD